VLAKAAPKAIALSDTDVFWSTFGAKGTSSPGYIIKVPKP
jgi:hypothetical protein